jgi:hypothetical protein
MNSKREVKITSFDGLNTAKLDLANKIKAQEEKILNSPVFKIPAAIFQGGSFKGNLKSSIESFSLDHYKKAAMNLLSTVLMTNKRTRKFFVGFIIAKEMVPFILDKVNEYVKK